MVLWARPEVHYPAPRAGSGVRPSRERARRNPAPGGAAMTISGWAFARWSGPGGCCSASTTMRASPSAGAWTAPAMDIPRLGSWGPPDSKALRL